MVGAPDPTRNAIPAMMYFLDKCVSLFAPKKFLAKYGVTDHHYTEPALSFRALNDHSLLIGRVWDSAREIQRSTRALSRSCGMP